MLMKGVAAVCEKEDRIMVMEMVTMVMVSWV